MAFLFALERYLAMTRKEFQQLGRNPRLLVQLIVPPTIVLVIFGYALNPQVKHLRTGIVDHSRTKASRDLISALTANEAFTIQRNYVVEKDAEQDMRALRLDLFLVIAADFDEKVARGLTAEVQVLVDGVNANSAAIAQGYLAQAISDYNRNQSPRVALRPAALQVPEMRSAILFNPGLVSPWQFVTGVMSVLLFINGSLLAAALAVREKEVGTVEQLLMSPAQTIEILLAKTTPVLLLLMLVLTTALVISATVFGLPVRGSLPLLYVSAALAAFSGIGIGIMLATFSRSQQQSQLLAFFINPPLVMLSGSFAPIENMPWALQYVSYVDPLRYLAVLVRGITIKGSGLDSLWQPLVTLACFSVVLYGLSAWRFRKQLG